MLRRPRRGALGLRGRIVGAVVVTTVATLGVAALALLGPLESSLRHAALTTLRQDLGRHPLAELQRLDLRDASSNAEGLGDLQSTQQRLATRLGGSVYLLGYPGPTGIGVLQRPP